LESGGEPPHSKRAHPDFLASDFSIPMVVLFWMRPERDALLLRAANYSDKRTCSGAPRKSGAGAERRYNE
jgi:hypothetical protein